MEVINHPLYYDSILKTQADGKTVTYTNPIAINIGYDYRYAYGNMFMLKLLNNTSLLFPTTIVKGIQLL